MLKRQGVSIANKMLSKFWEVAKWILKAVDYEPRNVSS